MNVKINNNASKGEASFLKSEIMKWFRPGPDTLIHYVTSRCNAKCAHCYFLDRLNQKNDLTPAETLRLIEGIGPLKAVLIGGGEPFLAPNLVEVLTAYVQKCGVKFIQIPTMAYHTARIEEAITETLTACPELNLTINVSLDGFENFHNENRKVKNLFNIAIENIKRVVALKKKHPRLRVCVVTVLMPENFSTVKELGAFIRDTVDPDAHILEPVRAKEFNLEDPQWRASADGILSFWKDLIRHYYGKEHPDSRNLYASRALRKQILDFTIHNFNIAYQNFLSNTPWPMDCVAGSRIAVLYPEGDVAVCELRKRAGNVKDHGMNLKAAMSTPEFKEEIAGVKKDKCFCTHGCFIPPSVRYSPATLAKMMWQGNA